MTTGKSLKRAARARARKTGESYSIARLQITDGLSTSKRQRQAQETAPEDIVSSAVQTAAADETAATDWFNETAAADVRAATDWLNETAAADVRAATDWLNETAAADVRAATRDLKAPIGGGLLGRDLKAPIGGGLFGRDLKAPIGGGLFGRDLKAPIGGGLFGRDPKAPIRDFETSIRDFKVPSEDGLFGRDLKGSIAQTQPTHAHGSQNAPVHQLQRSVDDPPAPSTAWRRRAAAARDEHAGERDASDERQAERPFEQPHERMDQLAIVRGRGVREDERHQGEEDEPSNR